MEKPIRIIENERIRTFNDKLNHGISHALNFMLGLNETKIQISYAEPFLMPIEAYIQAYKKKSILVKIHAEDAFSGEIYWFFELKTAIILSSMMSMLAPNLMENKIQTETFDALDYDSFGEVSNQLSGILDRAFRTLTYKKIHLRMDFDKKIYPEQAFDASNFQNKEEYVVLLSTITIPGQGSQKLTLLLPRSLYEVLLNIDIKLQGIDPKKVLLYTASESRAEEAQKKLNSRYVKVLVVKAPDDIFTMLDTPDLSLVAMDLKNLSFPLQHQDAIFLKRLIAQKNLSKFPFFFSFPEFSAENAQALKALGLTNAHLASFDDEFLSWCSKQL